MRIDHVSYAAESDGLVATAKRLAELLGLTPRDGGIHPRFGTRNMVLPLAEGRYLEVVEVLDHPAADKAPFGQAVRARSVTGGGWMGWVVAVEELETVEQRLGRQAVDGNRHTPEGVQLTWRQIGVKGLMADPQLPFFIRWDSLEHHPSTLDQSPVKLTGLQISGNPGRVREWLGLPGPGDWERGIEFDFRPNGAPSLRAVTFETPDGPVTI